jgi:hypothetical protein
VACRTRLAAAGVVLADWAPSAAGRCTVIEPVELVRTALRFDPPLQTSCAMAAAWLDFEPRVIALARRETGRRPVALRHFGSYGCRPMTGNRGRLSLHAQALALDLAGLVLEDGRSVEVARDWRDPGPAGRLLRGLAAAACRDFGTVLTPDSDRFHWNHIHLDIGPWQHCPAPSRRLRVA